MFDYAVKDLIKDHNPVALVLPKPLREPTTDERLDHNVTPVQHHSGNPNQLPDSASSPASNLGEGMKISQRGTTGAKQPLRENCLQGTQDSRGTG